MNVVSHKAIRTFCQKYRDAWSPLDRWYRVAKRAAWANFAEVKQTFSTADFVAPYIVFDIGGNKYRLIALVNFERKTLLIDRVLTHGEYNREDL